MVIAFYQQPHDAPGDLLFIYLVLNATLIFLAILVGLIVGKLIGDPLRTLDDRYPIRWRSKRKDKLEHREENPEGVDL